MSKSTVTVQVAVAVVQCFAVLKVQDRPWTAEHPAAVLEQDV